MSCSYKISMLFGWQNILFSQLNILFAQDISRKHIWHFIQNVFSGNNLYERKNPIFLKKKKDWDKNFVEGDVAPAGVFQYYKEVKYSC